MSKFLNRLFAIGLIAFVLTSISIAQDPPPVPTETPAGGRPTLPGMPGGGASQDPQPYDKVITKDAKTRDGIFKVHKVKDKYYYEIPKSEIDKQFLMVTQIASTTVGVGYGGQALGRRVVRWERNENKINLRNVNFSIVADPTLPIAEAVRNSNHDTILMSFPVAAWGPDEAAVIDVTRLFTTDMFEISARQRLNATTMDSSRTYIERISPFPTNIEARATHTYTRIASPAGAPAAPASPFAAGMNPGSATVVLHHSMVKLPENPMMPRLFDERVGYFSVSNTDYGRPEHRAQERRFITRWRLEKKDPNAAMSEPVKPIVYYIDRATPAWLVPFTKRGVEKWQKAFEAAGFKNAIIAKMQPSKAEDPEFDPEDARYSVIRWLPSTIENASGPHVNDPRTGEILESDIQMYHNIMNLQRSWYFLQVGPLDPRVAKLPMPDDLMGTLVEYVVAHEVGHTLGFQHNMKASSTYPQEKVRDAAWVKKMGHTPTLMDYSRFNYVAQPEDKIDPADLVPGIGPYDEWATMWGYKPIPTAKSSDDELKTLNEWAREQDKTPWLRFSTAGSSGSDPGELTEAVGDADAVRSTTLGVANLKRVAKMLVPATTTQAGQPYNDLNELYGRMLGQWTLEMNHVAAIVGGYNSQQKHIGQTGVRFDLIPRARQAEAVRFLNDNAFATPMWAIDKEILRRIEPIGALNRVRNAQNSVLNNLLSSSRFARLVEQSALDGNAAYDPAEFLADVRNGVFSELNSPTPVVDAYRRNLHRAYLDIANNKLNAPAATLPQGLPASFAAMFITSGDERAFYRAELREISAAAGAAMGRATDRATKIHLQAVQDQIGKILDPNAASSSNAAANRLALEFMELYLNPTSCWPDYVIEP
ncbi:MAG TPA: zinc-dependent metalloprotease [Pyrinomonadaceae bacterium]|nr:zinc-dependent metalloprotease [Chloracidobacterium sp.]HRJ90355.1 zinc-dependent metalloprotease [Pyrinomonadaceae bacterium]HRK52123.1 zinc-dependent metalloprotease [Pyrinomonadaceae bacterium]